MPHVNIKHFPTLSEEQYKMLSTAITDVISKVTGCDKGVISIAAEAVEPDVWNEQVYIPEIIVRKDTLIKLPDY